MEEARAAFVIWVDPPDPGSGDAAMLAGRVEHLQTSARATFQNADELLAFLEARRRDAAGGG